MMARLPKALPASHVSHRVSAEVRLAKRYGGRPRTWKGRMTGPDSCYLHIARINTDLIENGEADRALTLMVPVDASLGPVSRVELVDALHQAEIKDAAEQLADENFRDKLRRGVATPDDARDYIARSVAARRAAEVAEQAARRWIDEQNGGEH